MPGRKFPLATGQIYHVFNRGINKQPIHLEAREYSRALDVLEYYSFASSKIRFSKFLLLSQEERSRFWESLLKENIRLVDIISFCFMANHFHFLLKQKVDNGISKFTADFQNSYTRYFNTKRQRFGPLLQGRFKAVRIEDENQLLHVNRYIHLNPYSSFVVKTLDDLMNYPWSSFIEYVGKSKTNICSKEIILSNFADVEKYKEFIFDQADYQRELESIKHLLLE